MFLSFFQYFDLLSLKEKALESSTLAGKSLFIDHDSCFFQSCIFESSFLTKSFFTKFCFLSSVFLSSQATTFLNLKVFFSSQLFSSIFCAEFTSALISTFFILNFDSLISSFFSTKSFLFSFSGNVTFKETSFPSCFFGISFIFFFDSFHVFQLSTVSTLE